MIVAKKKKPTGFGKFNALARLLVQVPKAEVDEREAARQKRKRRK